MKTKISEFMEIIGELNYVIFTELKPELQGTDVRTLDMPSIIEELKDNENLGKILTRLAELENEIDPIELHVVRCGLMYIAEQEYNNNRQEEFK